MLVSRNRSSAFFRAASILLVLVLFAACGGQSAPTASLPPTASLVQPMIESPTPSCVPSAASIPVMQVGGAGKYHSIQSALDAARDGDMIEVAQGTYPENIIFNVSKRITLQGGWSEDFTTRSDDRSLTVIDGGGKNSVFDIRAADGVKIVIRIEGFTIRNGAAEWGGGISAVVVKPESSIDLQLTNNDISKNVSRNRGGGIYLQVNDGQITAVLRNNTINGNTTNNEGAGIRGYAGTHGNLMMTLTNNVIKGNVITHADLSQQGGDDGGGIAVYAGSGGKTELIAKNNQIIGNKASWGGGVFGYPSAEGSVLSITLTNNIIAYNEALGGGGIFSCSGTTDPNPSPGGTVNWSLTNNTIFGNLSSQGGSAIHLASGSSFGDGGDIHLTMHNDLVWGNRDPTTAVLKPQVIAMVEVGRAGTATIQVSYSDIQSINKAGGGTFSVDHVISQDPLLSDPVQGDFSLKNGSPAIDGGDPDPKYNDRAIPPGKGTERADLGAYGGPNNENWNEGQ